MNNREFRAVIFTDLDGTLLDFTTYAWESADASIRQAVAQGHPVVFCSSKTRAEQLVIQRDMGIAEPFITENGSAIFIPRGYFADTVPGARPAAEGLPPLDVVELGIPAADVRAMLHDARRESGLSFRGYDDLTLDELVDLTGLDPAAARRAACREYSETIVDLRDDVLEAFSATLATRRLACFPGGRFHTVTSAKTDKGRAVRLVADWVRRESPGAVTVGIGDSPNDLPMLEAVQHPFLVQRPDGTWSDVDVPDLRKVEGIGPEGWRRVVLDLLGDD